jgi:hypothetical protein
MLDGTGSPRERVAAHPARVIFKKGASSWLPPENLDIVFLARRGRLSKSHNSEQGFTP